MSHQKPSESEAPRPVASRRATKVPIFLRNGIALAWLGLLLLAAQGCSDARAHSPLVNTRGSDEELAQAVLDAVASRDEQKLQSLMITRDEYEQYLWPEMPDKKYTQFSFVWSLNRTNSRKGIRQLLSEWGGVPMEVVSIDLGKKTEVYDSFTLYLDTKVKVRRTDTGEEGTLPSFDVLVKYGRSWKLMNYREL